MGLLFFKYKLPDKIERGVDAERNAAAFHAVFPVISGRIPKLIGNYISSVRADDPRNPNRAFAVCLSSRHNRYESVADPRAYITFGAGVKAAIESERLIEAIHDGVSDHVSAKI